MLTRFHKSTHLEHPEIQVAQEWGQSEWGQALSHQSPM